MTRKRLLMVAFHYPPIQGSSGYQRTLAFSKYLPACGWQSTVLTTSTRAYPNTLPENQIFIPEQVDVVRAPAWDAARHFAIRGRYPDFLALPDRWQSWIPGGIVAGMREIRQKSPAAIFSTFPVASAHIIALALHRLSGLPWIADLRDPMAQDNYPTDPAVYRAFMWIEQQVFRHATYVVVTTPGTAAYYHKRYGELSTRKLRIIANGFDEDMFPSDPAPPAIDKLDIDDPRPISLLHSGLLYPKERDPIPFLRAVVQLKESGELMPGRDSILFRATGYDNVHGDLIQRHQLNDLVRLAPSIPHADAVSEILAADALILFQASNCNFQIPAKTYEYLQSGRPILGITDPDGDTGQLLRSMGVRSIAALEDEASIARMLRDVIPQIRAQRIAPPCTTKTASLSRRARTAELAALLDDLPLPPSR